MHTNIICYNIWIFVWGKQYPHKLTFLTLIRVFSNCCRVILEPFNSESFDRLILNSLMIVLSWEWLDTIDGSSKTFESDDGNPRAVSTCCLFELSKQLIFWSDDFTDVNPPKSWLELYFLFAIFCHILRMWLVSCHGILIHGYKKLAAHNFMSHDNFYLTYSLFCLIWTM